MTSLSRRGQPMGYNYSKEFLLEHTDLVKKLIQVAATGEVLVYDSDDWDIIKNRQLLINNLLSSIVRNMPDYKDLREKVRCWTAFGQNNRYNLFVGIPRHKMTGSVGGRKKKPDWSKTYVPAGDASGGLKYTHPSTMSEHNDWLAFVGKVSMLPETYAEAVMRTVEPMLDRAIAEDYFGQPLEHKGWMVHLTEHEVIFRRIGR
jgi:hypothetical protein